MSANSPTQRAMDRGVDFWKILAWTGLLLGGALFTVDPIELVSSSSVPICIVAAGSDTTAIESSVTRISATTRDEGSAQLFGMDTELVADGALVDKRRRVQAVMSRDLVVVARCKAGKPCPASAQACRCTTSRPRS